MNVIAKPRDEGKMKRPQLSTKISAKGRAKQSPGLLHDSGGKLFCTPCNCVLDHWRKSTLENDFATAKHARMDQEMDVEGEGMEDEECASVRGYVVSFHFHSGLFL